MADQNTMRYSDFIKPDESIVTLIKQLEEVATSYDKLQKELQTSATKTEVALKKANSTSTESQELTKKHVVTSEQLTQQNEKLRASQSNNGIELAKLKGIQSQQNNLTKLSTQLNKSQEGSYNRLSAQYSLNKIRLNAMSKAQRGATDSGVLLEKQTRDIYAEMERLQQATGKHTLGVGNYGRAYNGLSTSVNQLTREMPVMAMNMNTFFLAISNNIPMLVDEIDRIKVANAQLRAEMKKTVPLGAQLAKAIFSWQTLISIGVALLTIYGAKIIEWAKEMIKSTKAVDEQAAAIKALEGAQNDALKTYQKEIFKLKLVHAATQDVTKSREEQIEAVKILKKEWPEHFQNLTDEEILAGKAAKAYELLASAMLATAQARAYENKITENYEKIIDLYDEMEFKIRRIGSLTIATAGNTGKTLREIAALHADNAAMMDAIDLSALFPDEEDAKVGAEATKKYTDKTLEYLRAWTDSYVAMREEGFEKERVQTQHKYERDIEDLQIKMASEEALTKKGREAIRGIIENKRELLAQALAAIDQEEAAEKREARAKDIANQEEHQRELYAMLVDKAEQDFDLRMSEIDALIATEAEKTRLTLEAEKERIEAILALQTMSGSDLTRVQIMTYRNILKAIDNELNSATKGKDIYDMLGIPISGEGKRALKDATKLAIDNIKEFMQVQLDAAKAVVDAAKDRTAAAQKNVDAEIEARNNGYAYNLTQTQKELSAAKKAQEKALKQQEKAQKAQERVATISQAVNLVTASSQILKDVPFPLSIAALALMWGTFIAAKVKAQQVTKQSYGEGGYEILRGGSHASGDDVQLGRTADGKDRRGEGGELMAIINKNKTRKYKAVLPDIINSLNKGDFEKRYHGAYDTGGMSINVLSNKTDMKGIERDVKAMREQSERKFFVDGKGRTVERYKNLTRKYHAN